MFQPDSLTATVFVKFNYKAPEIKVEASEIEMVNEVLKKASDMSLEQLEFLSKFASHLNNLGRKQSPS